MKLIDTSSWIHALRKDGNPDVRERVQHLLLGGMAAWCPINRVELWQGVKAKREQQFLEALERDIVLLPLDDSVWNTACQLGRKARQAGKPVPTTDVMITACAQTHGVEIEHCDKHLDLLSALRLP